MKITLDQNTLAQAVTSHLRNVGVTADIVQVDFRYTRTPYTVFAEVELSEARIPQRPIRSAVVEKESVVSVEPTIVVPLVPIVDPETLPPLEPVAADEPKPETTSTPLFGG